MNKNNTTSNSLSNNITKKTQSNQKTNNNISGKPTIVDSIVTKVKENANNDLKIYIMIVIPILFLLGFLVYKYNFSSRAADSISKMDYKTKISLPPMPQCYDIEDKEQYKLCDYYINSSFMTPCVGNQHYDYVSNDMINEVLQSGARYIQIPICEEDVTLQALPVVATAVYGQPLITSLNTLEIRSVLKTIRGSAFKINSKNINYPLIIHLILNTNNIFTINTLSDNISEVLGDLLIDASKYQNFPIFLEKLCKLEGKIILFSTPGYVNTKLAKFIAPTTNVFEIYHFSELGPLNMPNKTIYQNTYNKKLSSKQQYKSDAKFKQKYPSFDYVINNINSIGDTILNDKELLNNLTSFNKIGMTVVKPHFPDDVISLNYESSESIYYGCQFTTMNFQVNDINMQNYLSIFKESSFRLKPSSLRFSEAEEPLEDIIKKYKTIVPKNDNIIDDFYLKYNNLLIAFESYTLQNTYLTQIESNLRFRLGQNTINDKNESRMLQKPDVSQCFIPRKSSISTSQNVSLYLESATNPGYFVTMNSSIFDLQNLSKDRQNLLNQTLYIVNPKTIDKEIDNKMVSISNTDDKNPIFLAYENKIVKAYPDSPNEEAYSNMTFILHVMPFKYIIKIITIFNGSLKTIDGNIIGVIENNTKDGTEFYVIPMRKSNNTNFDIFKDQFKLQNKKKKTIVDYDSETSFLYDRETVPNGNSIFNIESSNGYYTILNRNNDNLSIVNTNTIKFVKEEEVESNGNLFMIDITYELI